MRFVFIWILILTGCAEKLDYSTALSSLSNSNENKTFFEKFDDYLMCYENELIKKTEGNTYQGKEDAFPIINEVSDACGETIWSKDFLKFMEEVINKKNNITKDVFKDKIVSSKVQVKQVSVPQRSRSQFINHPRSNSSSRSRSRSSIRE